MDHHTKSRSALFAAFAEVETHVLNSLLAEGGDEFVAYLVDQGLGPLWHARTGAPALRSSHADAAAAYMGERAAIAAVDHLFNTAGIRYVVFKGAANRESLYPDPAVRTCVDIDVLVAPGDRTTAARLLINTGFRLHILADTISHEVTLSGRDADIDLHWNVLRRGRLAANIIEDILDRRIRKEFWIPSAEDTLFLLLVHPAFAKHVAGPAMGLPRVAEVALWIRHQEFDWPTVCRRITQCGVRTAAWSVARWTSMLAPEPYDAAIAPILESLQPGRARTAYLEYWLRHGLSTRLARPHILRLVGLSPMLHDRGIDVLRALMGRLHDQFRRQKDVASFGDLNQ